MNSHLNDNEFAELLGGNASQTALAHLAQCPDCSVEAREFIAAVTSFREGLAAAAAKPARVRESNRSWAPLHAWKLRTAGALAIMLMFTGGLLLDRHGSAPSPQPKLSSEARLTDAELLDQVNSDLASYAPDALQPATYLAQERQELMQNSQHASNR